MSAVTTSPVTFEIAVSRRHKNKTGRGQRGFNNSFYNERLDTDSLIATLTAGWPVTMAHIHAAPGPAARARGVKTARHMENFTGQQVIFLDDDRKVPGVVDNWLHDSFFSQWGAFFYESANSKPGAEKGRPVFVLDKPITCPELLKEIQKALMWRYPHVDQSTHDVTRIWYGAEGSKAHRIGAVLPFDILEREVLEPYRKHLAQQAAIEAEYQARRLAEIEQARADGRIRNDAGSIEKYLSRTIDGIFDFVTQQRDNRHKVIYWAGRKIGALESAVWAAPYGLLFADVETQISQAAAANGYTSHPNGGEAEILRTFADGRRLGTTHPADQPEIYERRKVETQPAQPGPRELERRAQRDKSMLQATERRQEVKDRKTAHYHPDLIPFMLAPDEYEAKVYPARQTFSSAAAWREHVLFEFPELDPDHEYRIKLEENREHKMSFCGRPFKRLTATGEIKTGRIMCGLCEGCKKLDRLNLRRALEQAILDDPESCLLIVTVDCKATRARITRRLRENDMADKVLPTAGDSGAEYDILLPSAAAALVADYEPQELLIAHLTEARLNRWLATPEGERQSGKLIPSRRELREIGERDKWEREAGPGTFELDLPGIVCEGELPEVYFDGEVHDPQSLQRALNEMADRQRRMMFGKGHVILGVITKKSYYALNDVDAICRLFNAGNEERRAKYEARRRKKTG